MFREKKVNLQRKSNNSLNERTSASSTMSLLSLSGVFRVLG